MNTLSLMPKKLQKEHNRLVPIFLSDTSFDTNDFVGFCKKYASKEFYEYELQLEKERKENKKRGIYVN